jgi:glucose/arabinose dehydrogenase
MPKSNCAIFVLQLALVASAWPLTARAEDAKGPPPAQRLVGAEAFGDWTADAPGVRRLITPADLPKPFESRSASKPPHVIPRPEGAALKAPLGFTVTLFAEGLLSPRLLNVAPNGDIFVAETYANQVRVLRPSADGSSAAETTVFAAGLEQPFGIAFYPPGPKPRWVYVANTNSVVRFPYRNGDLRAEGRPEIIVPKLPEGGHSTRAVAFSNDGARMFVSVGSASNISATTGGADPGENRRADVLAFTPEGKGERVFADGIRNCVGLAVHPATGDLWCAVNERDGLGDNLVPDYVTRVREGGFYGWPWWYLGDNEEPRYKGRRPNLKGRITVPDVLVQSHSASLQMTFYTGTQFPKDYRGDAFVAEHGSWNRSQRTGYKLIRVILKDGVPTGEYEDFVTGFVVSEVNVWGRPVGVATAADGSLLLSEDGNGSIWRIAFTGPVK